MSKTTIEFCAGNMHHDGTEAFMQELEKDTSLQVIEYGCLGNCGECYLLPFALVDCLIVSAADVPQLKERVMKQVCHANERETSGGRS
ncbi:DUF1450 domain-containing protein [Paenibacillus radicis (ex Gao et al. 2016)]|uniref:UPF0349 protein n=1 Tax=Paenibacillus radicis (ex Gao et al. 2016) TaxID=1737354 RepID=A0A917M3T9_9BACL|nr:DUF1450 domain-containing protein [Paenibacillus radicis (ex Gao et al. 2016)]GGG75918.1 UPF0349 protein [Paenibacillus radicis (ex Gao et al. 2016)]